MPCRGGCCTLVNAYNIAQCPITIKISFPVSYCSMLLNLLFFYCTPVLVLVEWRGGGGLLEGVLGFFWCGRFCTAGRYCAADSTVVECINTHTVGLQILFMDPKALDPSHWNRPFNTFWILSHTRCTFRSVLYHEARPLLSLSSGILNNPIYAMTQFYKV